MEDSEKLLLASLIVVKQAAEESLWFEPETAPEALLQRELRRLHAAIEGDEQTLKLIEEGAYS